MTKTTAKSDWLGLDEAQVARRGFLKGGAAAIGTGIGTFGMVRDNWVFDFKGNIANAAAGDEEPTLVPTQCPYCGVGCHTYMVVQDGKIVASVPDKMIPPTPTRQQPIQAAGLCYLGTGAGG